MSGLLAYLLVGGLSVAVDAGLLVLLVEAGGVPVGPASALAFAASVVVNFALNRRLAGGRGAERLGGQALRYGLLLLANLLVTVAVVSGGAALGVPYLLAKAVVVALSTAWNFVLYRRWVFAS